MPPTADVYDAARRQVGRLKASRDKLLTQLDSQAAEAERLVTENTALTQVIRLLGQGWRISWLLTLLNQGGAESGPLCQTRLYSTDGCRRLTQKRAGSVIVHMVSHMRRVKVSRNVRLRTKYICAAGTAGYQDFNP